MSSRLAELKTLWRLARGGRSNAEDHGERMQAFYAEQAEDYDAFRKRLLTGREALLETLELPAGGVLVDLGGGTGTNLEAVPREALDRLATWYIVDLADALLEVAKQRCQRIEATNVEVVRADATAWLPPQGQADVVLLSYSLTMMPDWPALLDQVERLLAPGGQVAVVDFYVSRKHPPAG